MARMAKWLTQVSCQVLRHMNEILVDFNQASKKKRVTFASKCSTLLRHPGKSLHESASYSHSIHRIAPMHQDLNKYELPSENTQSTPVHQTLEAHAAYCKELQQLMSEIQHLVPSPLRLLHCGVGVHGAH